jgi:uncharacterized protein (UPF0335 family)
MPDVGVIAGERLKSFIERIERLEEEKRALAEDIKEVNAEAKGTGFDTKIMRQLIRIRKRDQDSMKRKPCSTSTSARSACCPTRPRRRKPRNNADSHPLRSVILLAPAYSPDAPQVRSGNQSKRIDRALSPNGNLTDSRHSGRDQPCPPRNTARQPHASTNMTSGRVL